MKELFDAVQKLLAGAKDGPPTGFGFVQQADIDDLRRAIAAIPIEAAAPEPPAEPPAHNELESLVDLNPVTEPPRDASFAPSELR